MCMSGCVHVLVCLSVCFLAKAGCGSLVLGEESGSSSVELCWYVGWSEGGG